MDPVSQLISSFKIPIGRWGKTFFDFLTTNFEWFFDSIADGLTVVLDGLVDLLLLVPPVLLVAAIAGLAWYLQKSWKLALAVALGLLFIVNQDLWQETVETLVLVVGAAAASMAIGVPIGIWAAHNERGYRYLQPILDLMQTMPTFVYLIPVLILFGLGIAPGLIVTVIFAAP
ncbi:MAG: ABC transporter permease subunit, partial [Mesorhizobium sp.]